MKSQQLSFSNPEIRRLFWRYVILGAAFILFVVLLSGVDVKQLWQAFNS